jgi:transcriptional regulator GlxA family with amidase domain
MDEHARDPVGEKQLAQDLLVQTNMQVKEVARVCGYGGARQFIRAFKADAVNHNRGAAS